MIEMIQELDADIARLNAESAACDDRIARKIAVLDVRSGKPAEDLRWLKIDRAELRWDAVRGYLRLQREEATRELNRAFVLMVAAAYATYNALLRSDQPWVGRLDVFDGIPRIKRAFGDRAAAYVTQQLIPASLRDET